MSNEENRWMLFNVKHGSEHAVRRDGGVECGFQLLIDRYEAVLADCSDQFNLEEMISSRQRRSTISKEKRQTTIAAEMLSFELKLLLTAAKLLGFILYTINHWIFALTIPIFTWCVFSETIARIDKFTCFKNSIKHLLPQSCWSIIHFTCCQCSMYVETLGRSSPCVYCDQDIPEWIQTFRIGFVQRILFRSIWVGDWTGLCECLLSAESPHTKFIVVHKI